MLGSSYYLDNNVIPINLYHHYFLFTYSYVDIECFIAYKNQGEVGWTEKGELIPRYIYFFNTSLS